MDEEILKPIDAMTEDELIAVITVKQDSFNEDYKSKVHEELDKRGVKLGRCF